MAKMFKNIKSLFIIEEEDSSEKKETAKQEKSSSEPVPKAETASPAGGSPSLRQSKAGDPGKVTANFTNVLLEAMEQQNLSGFDYLEYKQSLNSLKKMPMDEPTRYQSAFAMAQTMGATPEALLKTGQHYIDVLHQEEQKFEQALAAQKEKQIGSKQEEMKHLEENIKAKAEQIKRLTQEIEAHQKEKDQLRNALEEAAVRVESTKNDFIASYNNLVEQIHQDLENIKKYLK